MEMRIYVANLAAYNSGHLVGKWIELPLERDELQEEIQSILDEWNDGYTPSEEWAIHDYELPFKIGEYTSPYKVNEWAQTIEDAGIDEDVITAILGNYYDVEEGLQVIENNQFRTWHYCKDMSDVAYAYYEETGMMNEIPEHLQNYIDWESMGRDMEINGTFLYAGNNVYVEIFH